MRPTSDRLRETLFNVIAPRIQGVRFLDLCAGSGAIGIEALSRGAEHATFVDRSRKMVALIKANLELCRISKEERSVIQAEATAFLKQKARVERKGRHHGTSFSTILPMQLTTCRCWNSLTTLTSRLITETGLLIVEHHHKKELPDELGNLHRTRVLKQGDSASEFLSDVTDEKFGVPPSGGL